MDGTPAGLAAGAGLGAAFAAYYASLLFLLCRPLLWDGTLPPGEGGPGGCKGGGAAGGAKFCELGEAEAGASLHSSASPRSSAGATNLHQASVKLIEARSNSSSPRSSDGGAANRDVIIDADPASAADVAIDDVDVAAGAAGSARPGRGGTCGEIEAGAWAGASGANAHPYACTCLLRDGRFDLLGSASTDTPAALAAALANPPGPPSRLACGENEDETGTSGRGAAGTGAWAGASGANAHPYACTCLLGEGRFDFLGAASTDTVTPAALAAALASPPGPPSRLQLPVPQQRSAAPFRGGGVVGGDVYTRVGSTSVGCSREGDAPPSNGVTGGARYQTSPLP